MSMCNYIFRGGMISFIIGFTAFTINLFMSKSKKNLENLERNIDQSGEIDMNKYIIVEEEDEFGMDTGYGYYIDFK